MIGEWPKNDGGEITADDMTKFSAVADAIAASSSSEAFILFAKTSNFIPQEIERCKGRARLMCHPGHRVGEAGT